MRALLAALLLAASPLCWGAPALSAAWSDLWRTPDQQGRALLDAGQPAQAADRFREPRWRAYADLEAGRYQDAAKLLAPFTDVDSEYNRGNALAKADQLQAALAAYDAALKQSPQDRDIRHNRDLVARALKQRQQSSQSSARNGKQGGRKSGSSGGQQQSAGGQQKGSGSQQSGAPGQQSGGRSQTASNGSQPDANRPGSSGQQLPGQGSSDTSKEAPGQAQRDAAAAAALARQQQQRGKASASSQAAGARAARSGSNAGDSKSYASGTQDPKQQPETERQLALDQWLRQIPDSPAGLLQRKFLIEHMIRQQDGNGDSQGGGQ